MGMPPSPAPAGLRDAVGRRIDYVRLSLTDRCDLRCGYCMPGDMQFLARDARLTADECVALAQAFVRRGVKRIRLTGGEPLARADAVAIASRIGALIGHGLDEVTLTTNATRLAACAGALHDAGVRRINISLDSRDPDRFRAITRFGVLDRVLGGIEAARRTGFAIKINMVVLRGVNEDEVVPMLRWCAEQGFDLSLIETMPIGPVMGRSDHFVPLTQVRAAIEEVLDLLPSTRRTGGPARYWHVHALGIELGLISPLTRNFCEGCNRLRVSAAGLLYMCLGHDDCVDLRAALRGGGADAVDAAIDRALLAKPARHAFDLAVPATARHMNATGG
jgi:GTP 3',8-cyclase